MQKYAKYESMKIICIICTSHFAADDSADRRPRLKGFPATGWVPELDSAKQSWGPWCTVTARLWSWPCLKDHDAAAFLQVPSHPTASHRRQPRWALSCRWTPLGILQENARWTTVDWAQAADNCLLEFFLVEAGVLVFVTFACAPGYCALGRGCWRSTRRRNIVPGRHDFPTVMIFRARLRLGTRTRVCAVDVGRWIMMSGRTLDSGMPGLARWVPGPARWMQGREVGTGAATTLWPQQHLPWHRAGRAWPWRRDGRETL